uniref:Uncharacterized protein n=1 Tax=Anguilla anguilla TaxID=7936 RepID=A0A0E9WMM7_ANGAN
MCSLAYCTQTVCTCSSQIANISHSYPLVAKKNRRENNRTFRLTLDLKRGT